FDIKQLFFFFFQAEDGIRDLTVTGVQTCALPISLLYSSAFESSADAPMAERASRNATSYGFTTRRRWKPKLLMARAAAPILSGLRVATRTTRRPSNSAGTGKKADSTT